MVAGELRCRLAFRPFSLPTSSPAIVPRSTFRVARGLLAEYAGAEGYIYPWGHLIEQTAEPLRSLAGGARGHVGPAVGATRGIASAHRRAADARATRRSSRAAAPSSAGYPVTGCRGASRRSPHALLGLLLADPGTAGAVRQWLATPFLTRRLAAVCLDSVERRVEEVLRMDAP